LYRNLESRCTNELATVTISSWRKFSDGAFSCLVGPGAIESTACTGAQCARVIHATALPSGTCEFEASECSTIDKAGIRQCDTFFGTFGSVHNTNHSAKSWQT